MTTPRTDDTAPHLPWAQTRTLPYAAAAELHAAEPGVVAAEPEPVSHPTDSLAAPTTAPALNPPTWSGRKTAIAAALAIGISSMGTVAAAAALPAGSTQGGGQVQQGGFGPGGRGPGGFGQQGTQQGSQQGTQQAPGGSPQVPGTQLQQSPPDANATTT